MEPENGIDLYKMPRYKEEKRYVFYGTNKRETEKSESDLKIREQIIESEDGGMKQGRRKSMVERKEKSR